jgi:enterochelin esterase-like enzyme
MKQLRRVGTALAAVAVLAVGALGVASYGRTYNLHRGFAPVVQLPRAGTGRLLDIRFRSAALHRRAGYMVYLPPGYSSARRYPVDYLLHGMPGQPHVFVTIANLDVRLDNLIAEHNAKPMILVYPDGRIGGSVFSDSEWANTAAGRYESYVLDVVHDVDTRFSTLPYRSDRVIGGFSAGAYGAINIALHHLSDFASVQAWSGYFTQTRSGVFAHATPATLAYNSPYRYVRRVAHQIRHDGLRVYMFVGRDDESSVQLLPMVARLRAVGAQVGDKIYPGGHDWGVWYPRLDPMLELASRDLGHRPASARASAGSRADEPMGNHSPGLPPRLTVSSGVAPGAGVADTSGRWRHRRSGQLTLIAALLLVTVSGALINVGFIVQQRGLRRGRRCGRWGAIPPLTNRTWLSGQLIGSAGFAGQIVAVALAPLTLVQAFAAGSLALSLPVAARLFGVSVGRAQIRAIGVIAVCLCLLPLGFAGRHGHFSPGILIGGAVVTGAVATAVAAVPRGVTRAAAAGLCYGLADAAIKADALGLRIHGAGGLLSGWTVLASVATLAGFASFQSALGQSHAVTAVSVMNALAAVSAIALGVLAFGESLGATPIWGAVNIAAIATVLVCIRPLARGQDLVVGLSDTELPRAPGSRAARRQRSWRATARLTVRGIGGVAAVTLTCGAALATVGLTYALRGMGWLALGPRVPDALPLLQLAGFAGQPLTRVAAAALLSGAAAGVLLQRLSAGTRASLVLLAASFTLLVASDASFALAHNLRFTSVALTRTPGLGPWLQALLLAVASAAPELWRTRRVRSTLEVRAIGIAAAGAPTPTPRPSRPELVHH